MQTQEILVSKVLVGDFVEELGVVHWIDYHGTDIELTFWNEEGDSFSQLFDENTAVVIIETPETEIED